MSKKKLLTFLGLSEYKPCYYTYENKRSTYTRFVQTAIYELTKGVDDMEVVVFLTKEAKERNWNDSENREGESLEGLASAFRRIAPQAKVRTVDIESSQDEAANWRLFDSVLQEIHDGDEIYFDITHSFRSIPFIVLIVLNYARLVKNATIGKIVYGIFEQLGSPREVDKIPPEQRLVPIVDVTNMVTLLDWTNGVNSFLRAGDTSFIQQLTINQATPILRETKGNDEEAQKMRMLSQRLHEFSQNIATCRGKKIPDSVSRLKKTLDDVRNLEIEKFKPLGVLLDKIHAKISDFEGENIIMDTFVATKWSKEHHLLQQAFTLLYENMVTAVCLANGLDPHDRDKREMVISCINISSRKIDQHQWRLGNKEPTEGERKEMESIVSFLEKYTNYIKNLDLINQRRNNINHAEMARQENINYDQLNRELAEFIEDLEPFFNEMNVLARQKV